MTILSGLIDYYEQTVKRTLSRSHLGIPGCERLTFDPANLPASEAREFNPKKAKFPVVLGVATKNDGRTTLHPLKSSLTPELGIEWTHRLVRLGVHPLDIVIATFNKDQNAWEFRTAVDHLYWTYRDQDVIDEEFTATPNDE